MSSIVIAQEKSTTNQLRLISQIFDSVIATTLILLLSPVLALLALYCLLTQGRITIRSTV